MTRPPVDFSIKCTYGDKTIDVSNFNAYVERTIEIPNGVDPGKITTGIVIDPDGTVRHVPTKITTINGKYYAKINSLTNSTYSVIWHTLEFTDMKNHWAKEAVNDMGSRMVINGVGKDMFEPESDITRAEFAAIIVRALGLKPGIGSNAFTDVKNGMWYTDYIKTAYEHKIISGFSDNTFRPLDKITREQAMAMAARAMKVTGLNVDMDNAEVQKLLSAFGDWRESSEWVRESMAACIKTGIITGRSGSLTAPKIHINRAEAAVVIRRLLQKSDLI